MTVEVLHKSSSIADKEITAAQIKFGELAVNYSRTGPFLQCKDEDGNIWRIGGCIIAATAPTAPARGAWWYSLTDNQLHFYNGSAWQMVSGDITSITTGNGLAGGGATGDLTLTLALAGTDDGLEFDGNGALKTTIASASDLGSIKVGSGLSVLPDGTLSAPASGSPTQPTPPQNPTNGEIWVDTSQQPPVIKIWDQTSNSWVEAGGGISAGGAPPANPSDGDTWVDISVDPPVIKIWDATTNQWIVGGGYWVLDGTAIKPAVDTHVVSARQYNGENGASNNVFRGYTTGNTTPTSTIDGGGFGTFTKLQAGGNPDSGANDGVLNLGNGRVDISRSTAGNNAFRVFTTGDATPKILFTNDGTGNFVGDVTINTDKVTLDATNGDIKLEGDIINTVTDGNQDIICDGAGLVELKEYNLAPMEVVTKHDIGTAANEVVLHQHLGTLAYKDDLALHKGLTVAALPTAPQARVGNINRVIDGAAALNWGDTVTAGGTAQYLVWFNGTNWTVMGK